MASTQPAASASRTSAAARPASGEGPDVPLRLSGRYLRTIAAPRAQGHDADGEGLASRSVNAMSVAEGAHSHTFAPCTASITAAVTSAVRALPPRSGV